MIDTTNLRVKGAAEYLNVGVSTIWLYVKQGKIKSYKISDRVTIFKRSELDAFIDANMNMEVVE